MSDLATALTLLDAAHPIALLPVRLETRFVISPPALRIRVYPDEIVADVHRRELTTEEWAAAERYWFASWAPAGELDAWRALVVRFGPERSAWLVRRTTPTNLADRPNGQPSVAVVALREGTLADATARLVPTAWLAIAYRGGVEIHRAAGADIVAPLRLSFGLDVAADDPSLATRDELTIDRELLWAVDFDEATAVGMALTMPLTTADLDAGFDRVLVVGVRTAATPTESAAALAELLDAHHYTRGLALVRQGTPTNSTALAPSGYPPPDDPVRSFAIERGKEVVGPGTDGAALSRALGLPTKPTSPFDCVDGTRRTEQAAASAMNQALWPCTLGYFLEQLMAPLLTAAQIGEVRTHFRDFVRGRGPLPAVRVGRVPYGVLPTTSIARWQAAPETIETGLAGLLQAWRVRFLERTHGLPRVGGTSDPDADLLGVLARDAASHEVRIREVLGPAYVGHLLTLLGRDRAGAEAERADLVAAALAEAGLTGTPRLAGLTLGAAAPRIGRAFVTTGPLTEDDALSPNYIGEVRTSSIAALGDAGRSDHPAFANPLLYHLLRQATLVEYARIGVELAIAQGVADAGDRVERELHQIAPGTEGRRTHWQRFAAPLAGLTGTQDLGEWLVTPGSTDDEREAVRAHQAALLALEGLPTAELDRLLAETLDTCAHRLDAWITSLATRRLAAMRAVAPTGVHVGAFGWVENLRRRTAPRPGTAGGFIHAPSSAHAAAAAILRNAHLTRTGAARAEVAIDLSSQRVRGALALIDGVRQGQPLGAILGYRVERALHDAALDRYVAPLRARFPLGRDPGSASDGPTDRIAARNVVDGLALRTSLDGAVTVATIPWAALLRADEPPVANADRAALAACLAQLEADVDATADLLLAESVYQAVQGNTDRASATLAALAGGGDLPEPQIAVMPRGGIAFTHRVAVLLGPPPTAAAWPAGTPRRAAEPRLDAWLGSLLADPGRVRCRASFPDPLPTDADHRRTELVTLADLARAPIDVLALARATGPDGSGELAARLAHIVAQRFGARVGVALDHTRVDDGDPTELTFLEALEIAGLLGEVVDAARPLTAADLLVPGLGGDAAAPVEAELVARATAATAGLASCRAALATALADAETLAPPAGLDPLREQLWAAVDLGLRAAVPASLDDDDLAARVALLTQARAAVAELDRRVASATAATGGFDRLGAVFGPALRILPTFAPSNRAELDAALAYSPTLVGDAYAPRRWFEGAARVRRQLADLRLATLAVEATSGARVDLGVAQLPHAPGAPWVGAAFDPAAPPRAGAVSLALHRPLALPAGGTWAGLLVDEWAELIPARVQETAFAVHHDAPGAEAAQCVLLAVPPNPAAWDLPSLVDILHETLDLAAIRAVDAEELGALGLFVPTIYLAANLAGDTITADLTAQSIAEDAILAAE